VGFEVICLSPKNTPFPDECLPLVCRQVITLQLQFNLALFGYDATELAGLVHLRRGGETEADKQDNKQYFVGHIILSSKTLNRK